MSEDEAMPQYSLPRSARLGVPDMLSELGTITVLPMDDGPVAAGRAQWWRLKCRAGNARSIVCIGERAELPEHIVATVCVDPRRLLVPWRLTGNFRLVRRLVRALEHAGATKLAES